MSTIYEGHIIPDGYQPTTTVPLPMPPNCGSGVQKLSPPAPNKEEVIIRLIESLNIGGEEADYKRVDIAFMQYEQIQKKAKCLEGVLI